LRCVGKRRKKSWAVEKGKEEDGREGIYGDRERERKREGKRKREAERER
jgi:hypothetical protein